MTSPQPVTFELESFGHLAAMRSDASMVTRTLPFPRPRQEHNAPATYEISDGCIALTEGMATYGS